MNYFKTIFLIVGALCWSFANQQAFADGNNGESSVGNGGQARVCENKKTGEKTIELFDYWEGKILTNYNLDIGPGSFENKIHYVLDRLSQFDPYRAARLRSKADKLLSHLEEYMTDYPLYKTNDMNAIHNPNFEDDQTKCYEVTMAIRVNKLRGNLKRFMFVKEAWNLGEGEEQEIVRAGIILHEIIGEDSLLREKDFYRDNTRFFNFGVSSDRFNTYTAQDYLQLLKDSEKVSNISTILIDGKHYLSQGARQLKITGNQVIEGEVIPDFYARVLNLDFETTGEKNTMKLNGAQQLDIGNISLALPHETVLKISSPYFSITDKTLPIILNQDTVSLTADIVLQARERTLENIGGVGISPRGIVYVSGKWLPGESWNSKYVPPTSIELQGQSVIPYGFHLNGAVAEIKLSPETTENRRYSFTTVRGETIELNIYHSEKNLVFNEEEMLESYTARTTTIDPPGVFSDPIETSFEAQEKDPEITNRFFNIEVGAASVQGKNGDETRAENTRVANLDLITSDHRAGNFSLLRFHLEEGDGKSCRTNFDLLRGVGYFSDFNDSNFQYGINGAVVGIETDKLRGFEAIDAWQIGPSVRFRPFPEQHFSVDVDTTFALKGRAYVSDSSTSRVSPEWVQQAEHIEGGPIKPIRMDEILTSGRNMTTCLVRLNLCYKSIGGHWACDAGGYYKWEQLDEAWHDKLSPYQSLLDKNLERWNAHLGMKYYFDKINSDYDADNYFFLRADVDDSELGTNLQTLLGGPASTRNIMERRVGLSYGLAWEW